MQVELDFVKMNGLGNDFVFVDDLSNEINLSDDQVKFLCDRRFGIGADGVILVRPSTNAECSAYMHYINSDGTLAQMCGNGVRCFAKYLVDRGYVNASDGKFVADTLAGPRNITFSVDENDKMTFATVNMGKPILNPEQIPVNAKCNDTSSWGESFVNSHAVSSPWGDFAFTFVSMGNPHAICFIDDFSQLSDDLFNDSSNKTLETLNVDKIGSYFESHEIFPEKSNIEFAQITPSNIKMRVYERGCAETMACGTGACAVNTAAILSKGAGAENDVVLPGGTLHIVLTDEGYVEMTGPAAESFTGTVEV
jgi:diaminopimelate epimerase